MLENLLPDEVMALTLYGEARGEPIEGQIAVANVIMNRMREDTVKYKTVRDVCLEPKQFSCWNTTDPNVQILVNLSSQLEKSTIIDPILEQCLYIARGVMKGYLRDNTKAAKYYMTIDLFNNGRPSWAKVPSNTPKIIGNHVFFNV